MHSLLVAQDSNDVFPELALSLFAVVETLYKKLRQAGVRDVYFLSREGQPLMRLFEQYQHRHGGGHAVINCHYLEVSRRSTFMPSLDSLEQERFDTLFRQYRAISLLEFLSSLGLESHAEQVANELGSSVQALAQRLCDLPTSASYRALLANPWFQRLYETERRSRRLAFIDYLAALSGGSLPATLHLVDVGWKGTIQDNLYRLLCEGGATTVQAIDGYYVGLVAAGAAGSNNRKHGLLFSSVGERTPYFHIFNENRALFEVVLAADHGSVAKYEHTPAGTAHPVRSEFEEEQMVRQYVFPLQATLFRRFEAVSKHVAERGPMSDLFRAAAQGHARMLFRPTAEEMNWFSTVFHIENFGVFESSRFNSSAPASWLQRVRFTLRLLRRQPGIVLGFWPWLTIQRQALPGMAAVYRFLRSRGVA